MKKLIYLSFAISIVIASCTIEKRIYNDGYHVSWKNHQSATSEKNEIAQNKTVQTNKAEAINTNSEISELTSVQKEENNFVAEVSKSTENKKNSFETKANRFNSIVETSAGIKADKSFQKSAKNAVIKNIAKKASTSKKSDDTEFIILVILCFLLPPVAVGLATDWDIPSVVLNIILTLLCGLPGIIHALIVVFGKR